MNKLFEAITTYTDGELKEFYKFSVRKKDVKAKTLFFIGIVWLAFSFLIFMTILFSSITEIAILIVFSFFNLLIVFVLMNEYICYPSVFLKKHKEGNYFININVDTVTFYQDYIEITNQHSFTRISYYEVFRAYETKSNFYIYITNTNVAIINKMNFSIGTPQDLNNFLCYTIREKFKQM